MKKSIYASCIVMLFSGAVAFANNEIYNGQDVSGEDFSGKTMQKSSWINSTAVGANFTGTDLTDANFSGADLTNVDFTNVIVKNVDFTDAIITGANFEMTRNYNAVSITKEQLYTTKSYKDKNLRGVNLTAKMNPVCWNKADFSGQDLTGADLSSMYHASLDYLPDFTDAIITNANLSHMSYNGLYNYNWASRWLYATKSYKDKNLQGVNFSENGGMTGIDLSGQDLTGCSFYSVRLYYENSSSSGTYRYVTNFEDTIIKNVDFRKSNITLKQLAMTKSYKNKDLSGVSLDGFDNETYLDFCGFNLRGFSITNNYNAKIFLRDSDLSFARLDVSNVDITNSIIRGATINSKTADITSTKSYRDKDLWGTNINCFALAGLDLTEQNLQNSKIGATVTYQVELTDTNFTGADLRGAILGKRVSTESSIFKNTIMSDGVIKNFQMNSNSDYLKIRKYEPASSGNAMISAKVSEADAVVSGGSKLELDVGAMLEVVNNRVLSIKDAGELIINTDLAGSTSLSVSGGAGLSFGEGGKLIVNLTESITGQDAYSFAVISWFDDSKMSGLSDFVIGENLILTVQGENYAGAWNYIINGNSLVINLGAVPEPATYAAIFGAVVLAFIMWRKRR